MEKEERKVEYLELIYDLIFVYIIGRNNSLLHNVQNGFVPGMTFFAYILCSLAVIQIWNFSTFYINMHGRNGLRDHVFLFVNMYLLYYIGEGTRLHWESFQNQYHFAWALILINIGFQYAIEQKNHPDDPDAVRAIRKMMIVLFGEAAIVLAAIGVYNAAGFLLAPAAILYGIVMTKVLSDKHRSAAVDFRHLSERAMLYVVFTFGEMIITLAVYFEGQLTVQSVYFSACGFLIIVGLFLAYGTLYDRIIDRDMTTGGMNYMLIHVFLVFAMNSLTTALDFMQDETVLLLPKMILLIGSFLLFYICLFALQVYARPDFVLCKKLLLPAAVTTILFVVLMPVFRNYPRLHIAISVIYVFSMFLQLFRFSRTGSCRCAKLNK